MANKGINAGDMKVTNVADGVADKDAVNVSQLKKTDDKAEANKTAIQKILQRLLIKFP